MVYVGRPGHYLAQSCRPAGHDVRVRGTAYTVSREGNVSDQAFYFILGMYVCGRFMRASMSACVRACVRLELLVVNDGIS